MFDWRLTVNKNVIAAPINAQTESVTVFPEQEQVPVPTSTQPAFRRKKVWIDIDNSPHVPFFVPIIEELRKRSFELILTARDMYQVRELLDFFQLRSKVKVIGGHSGRNKALKVLVNCVRAAQLIRLAAQNRPDLALSHGSRAQVLACKALGIPTIMMHDYEHSTKTGFLEPNWILMPDIIPDLAMTRKPERTMKYPGRSEERRGGK